MKKFVPQLGALLLVIFLIFAQHRWWLFRSIYDDFGGRMGGVGDAYYNLSLYLQNTLNLIQGNPYLLEGDHYTWWTHIITITGHGFAPSLVFALLFSIIKNPIALFNILFFGNLFLLQLGIFFLAKYYSKNTWLSILASLMVPLSNAFKTFYVGHIHASMYWSLPFLILFLELLFDIDVKKTNLTRIILLFAISITLGWLFLAEWHVLIFSLVWLGIWSLFKTPFWIRNYKTMRSELLGVVGISIIVLLLLLPIALKTLNSSKTFNSVRSINDVAATNFNTTEFLGIKHLALPLIYTYQSTIGDNLSPESTSNLNKVKNALQKSESSYPDLLSAVSFWIGILVFIPWVFMLVARRGEFFSREFSLFLVFFLANIISLGPLIKIDGHISYLFPLPHYFLYYIFFPLAAIRSVWRASIVGYLALLILWTVILSRFWNLFEEKISSKPLLRLCGVYISILIIFFMIMLNNGWRGAGVEAFTRDTFLYTTFDELIPSQDKADVFVWRKAGDWVEKPSEYYSYNFSVYNLKHRSRKLNWVAGGIAGTYPTEFKMLDGMQQQGTYTDLQVELLAGKGVDMVIQEKGNSLEQSINNDNSLQIYYDKKKENQDYAIWLRNSKEAQNTTSNYQTTISHSSFQPQNGRLFGVLNFNNFSSKLYINPEQVKPQSYNLEFWQGGQILQIQKMTFGDPAFLFPGSGKSIPFDINLRSLKSGETILKLVQEDQVIFESEFTIVAASDYRQKIQEFQNQPVELVSTPTELPKYRVGVVDTPQLVVLEIGTGVIQNYPSSQFANVNTKIIADYLNSDNASYTGFPEWLGQPPCPFNGVYFPGDRLEIWCNQHLPFDDSFTKVQLKLNQKR